MPRRVDARAVAALGAAVLIALQLTATHWFYLYIVWFVPFVLVALFAEHRRAAGRARPRAGAGTGARSRVRRDALAALALLVAGWALTLWVAPWSDERVNDLFVYRTFAEPVLAGGLPYRDVFFEYPPLAAPVIALPGLAGTGEEAFRLAFAGWMLAAAAALVLLCGALAARTGATAAGRCSPPRWRRSPAARCCARTSTSCRSRSRSRRCGSCAPSGHDRGWRCSALGALVKGFPLVAVPVVLAWLLGRGRRREALEGALACAAVLLAGAVAALAVSPDGAVDALRYHLERPVQVESVAALRAARPRRRGPGRGGERVEPSLRRPASPARRSGRRARGARARRRGGAGSPRWRRAATERATSAAGSCSLRSPRSPRSPCSARCCRRSS